MWRDRQFLLWWGGEGLKLCSGPSSFSVPKSWYSVTALSDLKRGLIKKGTRDYTERHSFSTKRPTSPVIGRNVNPNLPFKCIHLWPWISPLFPCTFLNHCLALANFAEASTNLSVSKIDYKIRRLETNKQPITSLSCRNLGVAVCWKCVRSRVTFRCLTPL
jgi:hypothetical protein